MREVTIIEIQDLRFVLVKCPHCAVQIRMDLEEKFLPTTDRGAFMFAKCPSCRKDLDSAVQPALNDLYELYQRLNGAAKLLSFVVEKENASRA